MTFKELWNIIEQKNPQTKTGTVKLSTYNFKRAIKVAYKKGAEHKKQQGTGSCDVVDDIMSMFK